MTTQETIKKAVDYAKENNIKNIDSCNNDRRQPYISGR